MEKITGGLSNEVFKYKNLIFKFYNYSLLCLDYNFEEFVQTKLYEKYSNVPKIYQSICIDGKLIGRVEKFINATNVSKEHFTSEFGVYAKLLNNIHSINVNELSSQNPVPNFFTYLTNWTGLLDEQISLNLTNINQLIPEYHMVKKKANKYLKELNQFISHMQLETKLCHNDFQQLNVLVDSSNKFYVIDFEYASLNYIYYDIANYFAEFALDNTELKYNNKSYPNKEKRLEFYKQYFTDADVHARPTDYYEQFDELVLHFSPLVEYNWFIWALIKYTSTESIDYITYGKIRLENFLNLIEQQI